MSASSCATGALGTGYEALHPGRGGSLERRTPESSVPDRESAMIKLLEGVIGWAIIPGGTAAR